LTGRSRTKNERYQDGGRKGYGVIGNPLLEFQKKFTLCSAGRLGVVPREKHSFEGTKKPLEMIKTQDRKGKIIKAQDMLL